MEQCPREDRVVLNWWRNSPHFYGILHFVTMFTRAPHWAPFFCKWIQSVSHLKYSSIYLEGVRVPNLFPVWHRIKWAPGTPAPRVTRPIGDLFSAKVKNEWSSTSTSHMWRHAYRRLSVPFFYVQTFKMSAWFRFPHQISSFMSHAPPISSGICLL